MILRDDPLHALLHDHVRLVKPSSLAALPDHVWLQLHLDMCEGLPTLGLTALGVAAYSFTPVPSNKLFLAVDDDGSGVLLCEFNTPDKGPLPVWALEMAYFPTQVSELWGVSGAARYVHSDTGIQYVVNGRTDLIVPLSAGTIHRCGSRVIKALRKSRDVVYTIPVDADEFIRLAGTDEGKLVLAEDAAHHLCTQYRANIGQPPSQVLPEYFRPHILDVYRLLPQYKLFASYHEDVLLGLSVLWVQDDLCYWVGSFVGRSGVSAQLRDQFNLMYAILAQLIQCADSAALRYFNLGINTFGYKQDFNPEVLTYYGLEYMNEKPA